MSEPPLLAVRHLDAFYGDFQALFDLSVDVQAGEAVAVVGANGAGKSTLLSSIAGLIRTRRDAVTVRRRRHRRDCPAHAIAARGIALVPEGRALFPSLTRRRKSPDRRPASARPGHWNLRGLRTLSHAGRTARTCRARRCPAGSSRWPRSGARLMSNPRLLLCDEISLGLAPIVMRDIYAGCRRSSREGTSLILVEQDVVQALKRAKRVYLPAGGPRRARGRGRRISTVPRRSPPPISGVPERDGLDQRHRAGRARRRPLRHCSPPGLSLIFGVMRLVNIAHGDLIVLAAYMALVVDRDARPRPAAVARLSSSR